MKKILFVPMLMLLAACFLTASAAAAPPFGNAPAALTAATKRKTRLEELKRDPVRLELYKLREAIRVAKAGPGIEALCKRIQELTLKQAAETEAKLTPQERAERAERALKREAMRVELAPLLVKLRSTNTGEERCSLSALIQAVRLKYD